MLMQVMIVSSTHQTHSGSTGMNGQQTHRQRVRGISSSLLLLLLAADLWLQLRS